MNTGGSDSSTLRVVVASRNPVKLRAVETAFRSLFAGADIALTGTAVESGVSDQPLGDEETRRGARNRLQRARSVEPEADYWVGIEGGIEGDRGTLLAFAWMAVGDRRGRLGEARSATLPLPPAIRELVAGGMELGDANDRVFATLNSKQQGGAFGLLTGGRQTRESVYAETLLLALIPLTHPLFVGQQP